MPAHTRTFLRHWSLKVHYSVFLTLSTAIVHAQTTTNALPGLIPAYDEIPPNFWELNHLAIITGVFVVLLLIGMLIWRQLCPIAAPHPSPEKTARNALARLQNQPENGNVLSAVSQIVRRYISGRLGLSKNELTTTEFIAALARCDKLDLAHVESACSFLRECDVRKFSPRNNAGSINAVNRALVLIQSVEAHLSAEGQAFPQAGSQAGVLAAATTQQPTAK